MVRNTETLERFELEQARKSPPDLLRNLRIFEALWSEALALGVVRRQDPLEDIEAVVRLARDINSV